MTHLIPPSMDETDGGLPFVGLPGQDEAFSAHRADGGGHTLARRGKAALDPDSILDLAAKAILDTRAPGLGKAQWARRAAAAVIELLTDSSPPQAPPSRGPFISVRPRQCGGWIGLYDDGSLRFGVTGATEEATQAALTDSLQKWRAVGDEVATASPSSPNVTGPGTPKGNDQ